MPPLSPAPGFHSRAPWFGGDLQTLRNYFSKAPEPLPGERLLLAMQDGSGDRLVGTLHHPVETRGALVLLVHGLGGTEDSPYMIATARALLQLGHPVIRLNLRGAGASRPYCVQHYHAGRGEDLHDALAGLPDELQRHGFVVVGFSLGGNIALKFAAMHAGRLPLRAVASVSAPIDLALTSRHMLRPRNWLYHQAMLRPFCREVLLSKNLTAGERVILGRVRNFLELDDRFVAPRNGFTDAWDYYRRSMALPLLPDIAVPTLLVHAVDDPMVPAAPYLEFDWRRNPQLIPALTRRGGHVGFHGRENQPWYIGRIRELLVSTEQPTTS